MRGTSSAASGFYGVLPPKQERVHSRRFTRSRPMATETGASGQARSKPSDSAVRAQLDSILASAVFSRSPHLRRFLSFIVEQTPGRAGTCAQGIGARPRAVREGHGLRWRHRSGRSGRCQAAARQIARVLRRPIRPRRHLAAEGQLRARLRREFRLTIRRLRLLSPALPRAAVRVTHLTRARLFVGALALVAVVVTAVLAWRALRRPADAPAQLLPLASYPGPEGPPALSPDGKLVAFAWPGRDAWPDGYLCEGRRE